jgi:hypothetical protein
MSSVTTQDPTVQEVLTALDTMPREVTEWEAGFLENLLRQAYPLTTKQHAVLVRMAEEYLDPLLAAELRGQQRLFA